LEQSDNPAQLEDYRKRKKKKEGKENLPALRARKKKQREAQKTPNTAEKRVVGKEGKGETII